MATRPRDSHNNGASGVERDKENIPTTSPRHKNGRTFIPSLTKAPIDKHSEFFTDSFLQNNSSHSSLIPSPRLTNASLSKPRRNVRVHQRPQHRQTKSELPPTNGEDLKRQYSRPHARGTSSIHSTGLSTPPRSRDGSVVSVVQSPAPVLSSPPHGLTETYTRIDQEEDLAATEGEVSDPESQPSGTLDNTSPNALSPTNMPFSEAIRYPSQTRARTPTNDRPISHWHRPLDHDHTLQSVLSDPTGAERTQRTGLSFVDEFSDVNLRSAMTPHFQQTVQDREALERVWRSKKPIAFPKADNVLLDSEAVAASVSTFPHPLPERLNAFTKAGRIKLASDDQLPFNRPRALSDVTETIDQQAPIQLSPQSHQNWREKDSKVRAMPHNPRLQRAPFFPRNHGFPERATTQGDEVELNGVAKAPKARSVTPQLPPQTLHKSRAGSILGRLQEVGASASEPDLTLQSLATTNASSDIWAQPNPDRPMQSIERDTRFPSLNQLPNRHEEYESPEKSRRLDFDFTGQSFQVSDSPPVRTKSTVPDYQRDREIQGLAKRAVTTNRLSQLRVRESQEALRQASKSPMSDAGTETAPDRETAQDGHTPTSKLANENTDRMSNEPSRPSSVERSTSHDILQRLARGSSSTPRSTTPSEKTINGGIVGADNRDQKHNLHDRADASFEKADNKPNGLKDTRPATVAATPRVTGAWTDTILPDTIKTTRQSKNVSRYAQTPHISAGGWLDTPAPNGQQQKLDPVVEDTQDVPEDLMNGIVKESASDETVMPNEARDKEPNYKFGAGDSIARKILNEAKGKHSHPQADQAPSQADDSLMLGNTTIQSLEYVLDRDETDMTIRSQIPQTDTEVLGRLGDKLESLAKHIRDATKGVTELEHQISHPLGEGSSATKENDFSTISSALHLQRPIFFQKRKRDQRLARPTKFGWILLSILSWYFFESLFAELYAHPRYANQYTWPDRPEPEFPFVLPTMLSRWSRLEFLHPWIVKPLQSVFVVLVRMCGIWLGVTDGYVDGPAGANMSVGVQSPGLASDIGGGFDMMNDEIL